jgi:uncharacterized protein
VLWPEPNKTITGERELMRSDLETGYYQGELIDMRPIVREQMYLAIPQNPHCKESCLGLCSQCGANLNKKRCECTSQRKEYSPFDILRRLKRPAKSPS